MLQINNIDFAYRKKSNLFQDLSLELSPGTICGLLGKNGAGKSSLLRIIAGTQWVQEGEVLILGGDVRDRKMGQLSELYFMQEDYEMPDYKINRYVETFAPFYPRFNYEKFDEVLKVMEVPKGTKMKDLSFGQKKKTHAAFALATQVKLLILDEPTNGMDIPSKAMFRKVVSEFLEDDQSIIISTHQIRDLGQLLDTLLVLQEGSIIVNESLYDLSSKYESIYRPTNVVDENAIYHELAPGGHLSLQHNALGHAADLDIELFFNAISQSTDFLSQSSKV